MEVALLLTGVFVAVLLFLVARLGSLRSEIRELESRDRRNSDFIQNLTRRVYLLEQAASEREPAVPGATPPHAASPGKPQVTVPEPVVPQTTPVAPVETAPQPAKHPRSREDWEVLIGGNWLNKLGVLAIVVGIALFLAYSLTQLGPAGKVTIGFLVGLSMLGGGIAIEGRPRYGTFAQGLIGGGWAAIYFTAYAMHGMEGARIVSDPFTGTLILMTVSLAMIVYSFRYRSQAITSVAYLVAFVSLNVTTLTGFSVVAALLLAASLIVIAYHFSWFGLAAAGVALTYATFALRYDPVIYGRAGILNGQSILWIYWLLFESFDLFRVREGRHAPNGSGAMYLLNAAGFLLASVLHGSEMHRQYWTGLFAVAAAAYLASTAVRARLLPNADADFHVFEGRYFGPALIASAYTAAALIEQLAGLQLGYALLAEAEAVVVAGWLLKRRFLVHAGCLLCLLPVIHLLAVDGDNPAKVTIAGHDWMQWSLLALALCAALYANRILFGGVWLNSTVGSVLFAVVIHTEVQKSWATVVWAAMAVGLAAFGLIRQRLEFRWQAYLLAVIVFFRAWIVNINDDSSGTRIWTCALIVVLFYTGQMLFREATALTNAERAVQPAFSILGTAVLTMLLFSEVQGRLLTVALGIEGVALLLAGFILRERVFRLSGLVLFLLCIAKLFVYDLRTLDTMSRILSFIVLGLMMVGASWVYTRFREQIRKLL